MKKYFMAIGIAVAMVGSSANAGNLSNNYSYIGGHGKVNWRVQAYDHFNYVARDWNGDGRTEVLSLTATYSIGGKNVAPHAFVSRGDGSYSIQNVGGTIRTLTTEYQGNYFSGPIIVGNGNVGVSQVAHALNCNGMHCVNIAPRAGWHGATTADVDKDGKLDLIAFMSGTTIFSNFQPGPHGFHNGNGFVQDLGKYGGMNTGAFGGTFMDLNGDGYPEMITGTYWNPTPYVIAGGGVANGGITVWRNNGGKSFSVMQQLPGNVFGQRTGVRAMWNNGSDIIVYSECGDVCNQMNTSIRVYGRKGSGIGLKQVFRISGPRDKGHAPRLVDVNGDGKRDLVVGLPNAKINEQYRGIWLNNGNGTFRPLGTNIFAGVHKSGSFGYVIPTKANHDNKMDWIVVYSDGTFGTLMAPGGGGGSVNTGGGSTGGGGYADYVRGNGDLLAAFNRSGAKSIEAWGKKHWERYGKYEPHRKNKPKPGTKIKVKDIVNERESEAGGDRGMRFWQLGFVKDQLSVMNNSIINSNNVGFSFNDTHMFKGIEFGKDMSFNFGVGKPDEYGQVEDFVAGMSFGDTDIAIATDNTLLGWAPGQSLLNMSNLESRYINIKRSKTIKDWTLSGNMTYALAQGDAGYGYVKGMDDFHAMGFGVSANYVIDEDSAVKFGVSQPLRIERGALHFDGVIADMTPDGREIDYTMSYTTAVSKSSVFDLQLSYASDYNHYRSEDNAKIMAVYKGTW